MLDKTPADLWELHRACVFLLETTEEKSANDLGDDYALSLIVERLFERIGETIRRIYSRDPEIAEQLYDYRRAIDLRNIISHNYYSLNWDTIRAILDGSIPLLLASADKLLSTITIEEDE